MWLKRLTVLLGLCWSVFALAHADILPQAEAVPGGIAIIPLPQQGAAEPVVFFQHQRVMTIPNPNGGWQAVVGLPFDLTPGPQELTVRDGWMGERPIARFMVHSKAYPQEFLCFGHCRRPRHPGWALAHPKPPKRTPYTIRLEQEKEHIKNVLSQWSERINPHFDFHWPVQGRLASPFGLHRFYNYIPGKQHTGLDIAAPTGTPIHTPTGGTVVDVGRYLLTGNTVILDHGQGMFTIYAHMNRVHARLGQRLPAGSLIGEVGHTGRATGPHLHWGLVLNNARVNPMLCVVDPVVEQRG